MSLNTQSADFTQQALAALNTGRPIETARAVCYRSKESRHAERPFIVHPIGVGLATHHTSAALAIARLAHI